MRLKFIFLCCLLYFAQIINAQDTLMLTGTGRLNEKESVNFGINPNWSKQRTIYNQFGQKRYNVSYRNRNDSTIIKEWIYDNQQRIDTFLQFWNNDRVDIVTFEYINKTVRVKGSYDMVKAETIWTLLDGKMVNTKSSRYKTFLQKELEMEYSTEVTFDSLKNCECQSLKSFYISPEYRDLRKFEGKPNFEYSNWFNSEGRVIRRKHQNLFNSPQYKFFRYDKMGRELEEMSVYQSDTTYSYTGYITKGDSLYEKKYQPNRGEYYLKVYLKNNTNRGPCYYAVFDNNDEQQLRVEYQYDDQGYILRTKTTRKPEMIYDEFRGLVENTLTPKVEVIDYFYQRFPKSTFIPQQAFEPN